MKIDVYQVITDRVIGLLEKGTVPWHQPWKGGNQAAKNLVTRKTYQGINFFLLNASGYASPFWLTFKQAKAQGGRVKQGEKAFPVVFWKILKKKDGDETKNVPFLRYYSVFNVGQCEGLDVPAPVTAAEKFEPVEECERVVAQMPAPPLISHGGSRAFYDPSTDEVRVPNAALFESREAYYSTLFHELTHSTGHRSRLNRKGVAEVDRFGSDQYSREELIAEMGAAFLCGHCGIEIATINRSASYIEHWLRRLKEDRKLVVQAGANAQKACDLILGRESPVAERAV